MLSKTSYVKEQRLDVQMQSGWSIRAYCQRLGLSIATFYYHKAKQEPKILVVCLVRVLRIAYLYRGAFDMRKGFNGYLHGYVVCEQSQASKRATIFYILLEICKKHEVKPEKWLN